MTSRRIRRPALKTDSTSTTTHYSSWQPIELDRARKAYSDGAELFSLPGRYHSEGVVYVAGLKLIRGGSYLVTEQIKATLEADQLQLAVLEGSLAVPLTPALTERNR